MNIIKVLYVEDELSLGKIVKESLESRGFEVHMETNGQKATEAFKKVKPHICLLDVMLPDKDGFTIADEIRELDEEVPLLFLTAKTQSADVVKGFSHGANDYIRKPFSLEELIVRMQHALRIKADTPQKPETRQCRWVNTVFIPAASSCVSERKKGNFLTGKMNC